MQLLRYSVVKMAEKGVDNGASQINTAVEHPTFIQHYSEESFLTQTCFATNCTFLITVEGHQCKVSLKGLHGNLFVHI